MAISELESPVPLVESLLESNGKGGGGGGEEDLFSL
jgi:hypothetical protein